MKIKELIERLQQFNPELPIMMEGKQKEGLYDYDSDLKNIKEIYVALNCSDNNYWCAPHQEVDQHFIHESRHGIYKKIIKAVLLNGI